MRRAAQVLLAFLPKVTLASGVLNVLLAGSIALLSASASPTSITYSYPSATLTSASATCAGKGGIPPYAFGWSWASGGTGITIDSSASATTAFTVSGAAVNTTYSGVAQCKVTDARPITSPDSNGVSVSLTRIPLLPPSVGSATLVAGGVTISGLTYYGYYTVESIGSLSPSTDYNSYAVGAIFSVYPNGLLYLVVSQPSSNSGYISELSINGTLYATSSATYSYGTLAGYSTSGVWEWTGITNPFVSGDSYPVLYY